MPGREVDGIAERLESEAKAYLDKLAKGELSVDDAAAEIDARRRGR